uniref:Transmembrane protein n=1 Tax=Rhizophora mucronata TaxID=61149 RepID=A0A2P2MX20_RHIMU
MFLEERETRERTLSKKLKKLWANEERNLLGGRSCLAPRNLSFSPSCDLLFSRENPTKRGKECDRSRGKKSIIQKAVLVILFPFSFVPPLKFTILFSFSFSFFFLIFFLIF